MSLLIKYSRAKDGVAYKNGHGEGHTKFVLQVESSAVHSYSYVQFAKMS